MNLPHHVFACSPSPQRTWIDGRVFCTQFLRVGFVFLSSIFSSSVYSRSFHTVTVCGQFLLFETGKETEKVSFSFGCVMKQMYC